MSRGATKDSLERIAREVIGCIRCPRLREHCLEVARVKRAAYRDQEYWGLPVPSLGDPEARLLLVGLAPGAHGANRTGRLFTGDRSGDFLFASLHRLGLANQAASISRGDGLRLRDVYISAAARCAPPGNRPTPEEVRNCLPFLVRELALLPCLRVIVALGGIAFAATWEILEAAGHARPRPRPAFGHNVVVGGEGERPAVVAVYHPSQQNTQTGRLTKEMFDSALTAACVLAGIRTARSPARP
jgi:uracil-DNA glycosylase